MAEKIYNPKTGKLEWPIGSKERAAEMTAEAYKKAGFTPKPIEPAPLTDIQEQTLEHQESAKQFGRDVAAKAGKLFVEGSPGRKALDYFSQKPTASTKTSATGIPLSPDHPIAETYPTMGIGNIQKVSSPTGQSTITKAPKAAASPVTQTATGIGEGMTPFTPAINTPAPTIDIPATTTTEKIYGIGQGIGKWASDPKIARALTMAGLTTLATEPRRVPYSNAEMLGRAGLAGIGAYDQAAAGEAAGREAARKAGIEEREIAVKERIPAEATHFGQNIITGVDARTGKKVTGFPIYSGTKQIGIDPASSDQLAKMRREAVGDGGGGINDEEKFAKLMYEKAYSETNDTEEANRVASNAKAALKAWKSDKSYAPGTMPTQSWWDSWFNKPETPTEGRYVDGTQYTLEQIAAERKRRGL